MAMDVSTAHMILKKYNTKGWVFESPTNESDRAFEDIHKLLTAFQIILNIYKVIEPNVPNIGFTWRNDSLFASVERDSIQARWLDLQDNFEENLFQIDVIKHSLKFLSPGANNSLELAKANFLRAYKCGEFFLASSLVYFMENKVWMRILYLHS